MCECVRMRACMRACVRVSVCLSSLVCVVGVFLCTLMQYIGFMGVHFLCLIGCFSMIVWTPTVLSVLYACIFYFLYLHLFSATEHVSHGKAL